jgi:hypothetical protein
MQADFRQSLEWRTWRRHYKLEGRVLPPDPVPVVDDDFAAEDQPCASDIDGFDSESVSSQSDHGMDAEVTPDREYSASSASPAFESMDLDDVSISPDNFEDEWITFDAELVQDAPKSLEQMTQELDGMLCPENEEDLWNICAFIYTPCHDLAYSSRKKSQVQRRPGHQGCQR